MNNYDILGADESWSQSEIRKQFKLLSLKIHPDKSGTSELFKIVNIAYNKVMAGLGNDSFVYLPSEVITSDDSLDPDSLRVQVHQLLEEVKIKTACLDEANAQIRKLTSDSDVSKIAGHLKMALVILFIVIVGVTVLLTSSLKIEEEAIIPTPHFFVSSIVDTEIVKPKMLIKSKKGNWKKVPGYSKAGDFGDFIIITKLGIPTLILQIDTAVYTYEEKAKLRNETHGSCEAALSINNYQKVGLINPFARASIDKDFVFSIWLFDSVNLSLFKDFDTLTLICDDLEYRAHWKMES